MGNHFGGSCRKWERAYEHKAHAHNKQQEQRQMILINTLKMQKIHEKRFWMLTKLLFGTWSGKRDELPAHSHSPPSHHCHSRACVCVCACFIQRVVSLWWWRSDFATLTNEKTRHPNAGERSEAETLQHTNSIYCAAACKRTAQPRP